MTARDKAPKQPQESVGPITEFEVSASGTLRMADYAEAETRAEFYEGMTDRWERSPQDLSDAMDECPPLAWAVNAIYSDFREEVMADIGVAEIGGKQNKRRLSALKKRLNKLPEEPEEGAGAWLLALTTTEFETNVIPKVEEWLSEPPDWDYEDDYLPESGTAQGAALEYFRDMAADELDTLGVEEVEGDHPGSTYYAAELSGDIDEANRAAAAAGIPVRFVAAKDQPCL